MWTQKKLTFTMWKNISSFWSRRLSWAKWNMKFRSEKFLNLSLMMTAINWLIWNEIVVMFKHIIILLILNLDMLVEIRFTEIFLQFSIINCFASSFIRSKSIMFISIRILAVKLSIIWKTSVIFVKTFRLNKNSDIFTFNLMHSFEMITLIFMFRTLISASVIILKVLSNMIFFQIFAIDHRHFTFRVETEIVKNCFDYVRFDH